MAARLVQVKNKTTGTLVVVSGNPDANKDRCTVISGEYEDVDFLLGNSKKPMQLCFHGKTGGIDRNGLLVLLSFESFRITARLGCNPTGTLKQSNNFDSGGKVFVEFVEQSNSLKMKISMYKPDNVVLDYDVLVPANYVPTTTKTAGSSR